MQVQAPQPQQRQDTMRQQQQMMHQQQIDSSLKKILARYASVHQSTAELSEFLTQRIRDIFRAVLQTEGIGVSGWDKPEVIVEPSLDKARAQLPSLMARAKENLIATITKNDKVENAVVLVEWQALETLCTLAQRGLDTMQKFGESTSHGEFSRDEAERLSRVEIHRPILHRQSVADRRDALRKLAPEVRSELVEASSAG